MQKVGPRSKLRFPSLYLQQLAIPHVKHGLGQKAVGRTGPVAVACKSVILVLPSAAALSHSRFTAHRSPSSMPVTAVTSRELYRKLRGRDAWDGVPCIAVGA